MKKLIQALQGTFYPPTEIRAIAAWLLAHYLQCSRVHWVANRLLHLTPQHIQQLNQAIERLRQHEPIQYIIGHAPFYGRDFLVTPDVLIPRPETEELVHHLVQHNTVVRPTLIDIGTGSGCIAITLQKTLQGETYALDISPEALAIAQQNAVKHQAVIHWLQEDLHVLPAMLQRFHYVISNPPYIPEKDYVQLDPHVYHYEPRLALAVPNKAALQGYQRIIVWASKHLLPQGKLYLEGYTPYIPQIAAYCQQAGYVAVQAHHDLHNQLRYITAQRPT